MSGFDDNPFADPSTAAASSGPFSDPSIQRVTQQSANGGSGGGGLIDDYNPFDNTTTTTTASSRNAPQPTPAAGAAAPRPLPPDPAMRHLQQDAAVTTAKNNNQTTQQQQQQPAVMQPVDPAAKAKLTAEELQKRQEELDRRAADLEAREEALRSGGFNVRTHNWPPLPSFCPIKPCFYQDIGVDIPFEFQRIVRTMYYLWGFYTLLLLLNMFGGIAVLLIEADVEFFGASIISLVLYVPLSFIGWFRPVYRAFRSDSSLNFMIFFLVFTVQVILSVISTIGIKNYGAVGVLTALGAFKTNLLLGVFLSVVAACQGLFALACFIMLMRVHALYRGTTASFQRAQAEFATGILRNEHVQHAAANVAAEAARQTVQGNMSGSRY